MNGLGNNISGTQTRPIKSKETERRWLVSIDPINGEPLIYPPFKGILIIVLMIEGALYS